jgi:hypothetical protein
MGFDSSGSTAAKVRPVTVTENGAIVVEFDGSQ